VIKKIFDVADLDARDRSKLVLGLVVPRPIGWIGTTSAEGVDNLAPYSFFNAVSSSPPTVMFSSGMRSRIKDSLRNARDSGEFTWNLVSEEVAEAMNLTSQDYPSGVDEFEVAGLTAIRGQLVDAPLVAEAKANFECRVVDIVEVGEPPASSVVFGEVVRIHVREDLLDGTRIDLEGLKAVGRLAGGGYSRVNDLFWMERP
jgi:flavin reductase (DIM6/NTAB) family NADH-FMN oxidoreductase RutF